MLASVLVLCDKLSGCRAPGIADTVGVITQICKQELLVELEQAVLEN